VKGLKDSNHLANAYLNSDDIDRKACEQAIVDISEDQYLLEDMESWALKEEANFKPFHGHQSKVYKMKLERATYDTSKPARKNQPKQVEGYDLNFLSQYGIRLHDPAICGEIMIHEYDQDKKQIEQKEKIQRAQLEAQLKPEPKPEPKLEPCETYEEVKRWMEMVHPEYINEDMMSRIEQKCRVIEKEF
jgi:hypothetical protein